MENLTVWNYETSEIRTIEIDGEVWFVGRDICNAFGDTNSSRSLSRVDDEDRKTMPLTDSLGRSQNAIFINESGMYALLFSMNPQRANKDRVANA
jgi:anti-repressor protein